MENQRKTYTPEFKLKVVLESFQRDTTLEAVCQRFGVSKSMVQRWRQDFHANAVNALLDKRNPKQKAVAQGYPPGESPDDLKRIIGDLTVQLEIVKKATGRIPASKNGTTGGAGPAVVSAQRPLAQKPGGPRAGTGPVHAVPALQTGGQRQAGGS